ncbi:putative KHDC1-like protein [Lepus europaeus]|uniref:putative KHDC1-like protein n=1 Tax=Lepus europaeus TaxID=9983 RepID=UPI002B478837|nr:putative KHDC1-like protein [Lepus europaeus]
MRGTGQRAPIVTPWWTVPANFENPVNLLVEDEEVEQIFGQDDKYLRCIEEHSNTLIQLDRYYVACSYTRIIITGPVRSQRWLMYMMSCLRIDDPDLQAEGLEMLQHVRSEPLTKEDIHKIEAEHQTSPEGREHEWDHFP